MPTRILRMNTEIASEAAKAAPPVTVIATSTLAGWSLNNFIGLATLVYIILQAGYLLWKWRRDYKQEKSKCN